MSKERYFGLGEFSTDRPLTITQYPNGGWVVEQPAKAGLESIKVGAFSSAEEMLEGLSLALTGEKP